MERMTEKRIRHTPIVENGELVGIVSIGDVVKRKIEETEQEAAGTQGIYRDLGVTVAETTHTFPNPLKLHRAGNLADEAGWPSVAVSSGSRRSRNKGASEVEVHHRLAALAVAAAQPRQPAGRRAGTHPRRQPAADREVHRIVIREGGGVRPVTRGVRGIRRYRYSGSRSA